MPAQQCIARVFCPGCRSNARCRQTCAARFCRTSVACRCAYPLASLCSGVRLPTSVFPGATFFWRSVNRNGETVQEGAREPFEPQNGPNQDKCAYAATSGGAERVRVRTASVTAGCVRQARQSVRPTTARGMVLERATAGGRWSCGAGERETEKQANDRREGTGGESHGG